MSTIGFVGLGHMGTPMAINLLNAGHQVTVFDISPEACSAFANTKATIAKTLTDALTNQEVVITMLQTGEQVASVCLGKDGLYQQAQTNCLHIDCSSISVETTRDLHSKGNTAGLNVCDAPVSGGVAGAEKGSLTIMVGAETETFAQAKPILTTMGEKIIHAGPAGNGQAAKICNNMILGISMIAVSEAFTLGEKLGLSPEKLFEISSNATGQCWSMTSYSPVPNLVENVPSNNGYKPGFSAKMMLKDLNLSQDAAKSIPMKTALGQHATNLYEKFVEDGGADVDFSGIIQMIATEQTSIP